MNKIIQAILIALLIAASFVACSKWTETEALVFERSMTDSSHGEEYYRNLLEYKATDHPVSFGWYSEWTGTGSKMPAQLMGLPDSMDFVSMWGNNFNLSEEKMEDMLKVQTIKGTRVMMCFIIQNVGEQTTPSYVRQEKIVDGVQYETEQEALRAYWGWYGEVGEGSEERMEKAIRKYAGSILDSIAKYNFDGFDFDLEPNYGHSGNIASYPERIHIFLDEMYKGLGKDQPGSRKLLCVDGEPHTLLPESAKYVDYFILQAYYDSSYSGIDGRMGQLFSNFNGVLTPEEVMKKTILTSNFESYGSTGGPSYRTRDGKTVNQLLGYAMYSYPGVDARIGGIGAFRFVFDNNYNYLRHAITTLNPVIK